MTTLTRLGLRVALASMLVLSGSLLNTAYAQKTAAGVLIQNRASVNYSVGGVAQTVSERPGSSSAICSTVSRCERRMGA